MDIRHLGIWVQEAKVKTISQKLLAAQAVRAGMASKDDYDRYTGKLQQEIIVIRSGKTEEEVANDAWEDLALIGGA